MNAPLRLALAALSLALMLALAACNSSQGGTPRAGDGLALSLEVPSRVSLGETVPLRLTVRNVSDRLVELALGGQESDGFAISKDFVISLADGTEVWQWAKGRFFQSPLSFIALDPGEELVLEGEWDQRDNQGQSVAAGTYLVRGVLKEGEYPENRRLETEPSTLNIGH